MGVARASVTPRRVQVFSRRALDRRRRARAMGAYDRASAREGTTMTGAPKLEFVREMFDRVAETYDVVNGWLAFDSSTRGARARSRVDIERC